MLTAYLEQLLNLALLPSNTSTVPLKYYVFVQNGEHGNFERFRTFTISNITRT